MFRFVVYPKARNSERTSKRRKGCDERDGEGGGVDEVDDTADAGEEVAAVFHANTSLNERTGEIPQREAQISLSLVMTTIVKRMGKP